MNPEKYKPLYVPEQEAPKRLTLTEEQKAAINGITLGLEEVDPLVRKIAAEDVIRTLENGHPLNRLITNEEEKTSGYIACEDFVPREAYIKYFGTTGETGRSFLREMPAFLEYARRQGYIKINFHGWNKRLNRIMERYGFARLRTDRMGELAADFYEKSFAPLKTQEEIAEERRRAFEQKYINELNLQYEQILASWAEDKRPQKEAVISQAFQSLSGRLQGQENVPFGDLQKAVLRLKLARHFQQVDGEDLNVLYDAILESPRFINTHKGSLHRILEVHQEKTLQKIAEMRKKRAEMGEAGVANPYENLFTTKSGDYYIARLLNMPHLEEESQYMNHCVGTSDSYVNRIKKGEIEILSFRRAPKVDPRTQKLEGDEPVLTLEYNLKTKVIEQMKKRDDGYLSPDDPFASDVIDALKRLRGTSTDTGEPRAFSRINSSELGNFQVKDYHLLTDKGEMHFRDFNPDEDIFVLKTGKIDLAPDISRQDAAKLLRIFEGLAIPPEEIARNPADIGRNTRVYVGHMEPGIFDRIQKFNIEHIYGAFPEGRIRLEDLGIGGKNEQALEKELRDQVRVFGYAQDVLRSNDFTTLKNPERIKLVRLTVRVLGFENGATTDEIYRRAEELGLELCPAEVGPHYRLKYQDQPIGEWLAIAMKPISDRGGDPRVFHLARGEEGLWLRGRWADPRSRWNPEDEFVFRLRPPEAGKQVLES